MPSQSHLQAAIIIGDGNDTVTINPTSATAFSDKDIDDVGDIALDTISSDNGNTVTIDLADAAGDDFIVDDTGTFIIESDTGNVGIGSAVPTRLLDVNGDMRCQVSYAYGTDLAEVVPFSAPNKDLLSRPDETLAEFDLKKLAAIPAGMVEETQDALAKAIRLLVGHAVKNNEIDMDTMTLNELLQGVVVSLDSAKPGHVKVADAAYDSAVAGIISSNAGSVLGSSIDGKEIALVGKVETWVDTSYGDIRVGDLMVSSSTPGCAMRANPDVVRPGVVVGKAMEPARHKEGSDGLTKISVWVNLQ